MAATSKALPLLQRRAPSGIIRWLTTTDHKDIGIMYIITSILFFGVGGIEALIIRIQLARPENTVVTPEAYNQIFTMHGTTMVFLFGMPILIGIANYMVPLMIGARDMAFPRLNALSFWTLVLGGVIMYSSFLLGGAPDGGWFAYAPLTTKAYSPSHGMDFWALGIIVTGIGSIAGAINLVVTILNMRAPGMTLFKMPLFVWQMLVTAFLLLFAIPSLTVDSILLFLERNFSAPFFAANAGGDPLLWQHLFWFFGHPEVYILILPAFGIMSEVVPVFSQKPIFGYRAIVYSGILIGFLGFGVWAHHMFAVGMSPVADAIFSLSSMLIAIPTSIKIFSWIGTMWGGSLRFQTPLLYAIGMIAMFLIGGLSGITVAIVPIDLQVTDTYYVVAHFHYVLFGGTVFAAFAGIYYWFPKWTGKMLSETLGKWQFWIMLIGFNLTFMPMHLLGMDGMPRRVYTYGSGLGWDIWNELETIGSFIIAIAILIFIWNVVISMIKGKTAGNDPWDGFTLEWTTSSPPPRYDFAKIPTVHSLRPLWDQKHGADGNMPTETPKATARTEASLRPAITAADVAVAAAQIHMPAGSWAPLLLATGITILCYGMIYGVALAAAGIILSLASVIYWTWQKV